MRRVLIVDDDPRVRAALTALIAATTDLTVAAAVGTARDACAALATRPVDLILVDVQLPHRDDGISLIRTLSRRYLVVAMSIDGSSRAPALQAGAADFLEKNGNTDDILEALHRPLPPA
jgi:DNA-binding NarL/FixJ family response regulator